MIYRYKCKDKQDVKDLNYFYKCEIQRPSWTGLGSFYVFISVKDNIAICGYCIQDCNSCIHVNCDRKIITLSNIKKLMRGQKLKRILE